MKKFTDLSSPISWLFFGLSTFLGLYFLFHPTATEFVVFVVIDTLFVAPAFAVNQFLFLRALPSAEPYFPELQENRIATMSPEKTKELLLSFLQFPQKRARSIALGSYIKVLLTSGLVIVFYWPNEGSYLLQFIKLAFFEAIVMTYLYGASYVEYHDLVSRTISMLHKKYDWGEIFHSISLPKPKSSLLEPEHIAMVSVGIWSIALSALILFSHGNNSVQILAYKTITTSVITLFLFIRLYHLNRNHLQNGLEMIFQTFEGFDINNFDEVLPLHSSALLARFEMTFNQLTRRLRAREKEISEWIIFETEQSRFRALGEISGLIAHDLSGPLHVIKFCTDELSENIQEKSFQTYLNQLSFNTARALDLVSSLKDYLRNNNANTPKSMFNESHIYVLQLLNMQFRNENLFQSLSFEVDSSLNNVSLEIARNDLVHILYILYKNSIENLLSNNIPGAKISSRLFQKDEIHTVICISDNGTGLSELRFEELTSMKKNMSEKVLFRSGLGLRLTRRLIERNRGELRVSSATNDSGTHFLLSLPTLLLDETPKPEYELSMTESPR